MTKQKDPTPSFAEEIKIKEDVREQSIKKEIIIQTELINEGIREVNNELKTKTTIANFDSINDLEVIYSCSNPIKLPYSCYSFISSIDEIVPYQNYIKTLHKNGIVIITLGYDDDGGQTLEKIVNLIGVPHVHNDKGLVMWDIKSIGESNTKHLARSHQLSEFIFHTDCSYEEKVPDFFGLYVVKSDQMGGGKNLVIDVPTLLQHLPIKSFDVLQNYPVKILVPKEFRKDKEFIQAFIIDKELNIRYRREIIDFASLTTEQVEAITELEELIYSPMFSRIVVLNRGQIILLDNKRYLHARTAIKDKNRHLKRIRFFLKEKIQ